MSAEAYRPSSGRIIGSDNSINNIVNLLGGGTPKSDEIYNINEFTPHCDLIIGEDGKIYSLMELLQNNKVGSGDSGAGGDNGWTPVLASIIDGERIVLQIADWTGGTGPKPTKGGYIGSSGVVANITQAVNIRGAAGASGPTGITAATINANGELVLTTP